METKKGFSPNGIKKLLQADSYESCAYIYTDGIVLREKRWLKAGKIRFQKEFVHICPGDIPFYIHNAGPNGEKFIGRIVCGNVTSLIDGLKNVTIYRDNGSESSRSRGITFSTLTLQSNSGIKIRADLLDFIASDFTIQNDKPMSIRDWENGFEATVINHE
jgi:hypothetical protein